MIIFHGGCHKCTQQETNELDFCMGCQYFNANWDLPNLSNKPMNEADKVRADLIYKHRKASCLLTKLCNKIFNL